MESKGSGKRRDSRVGARRPQAQTRRAAASSNPRDEKRALFAESGARHGGEQKRRSGTIYVVAGVVAVVVVIGFFFMQGSTGTASADPGASIRHAAGTFSVVTPENGEIRLAKAQFDDRKAHFYTYKTAQGKEIDFFVLKSSDGVIRAAIDACDVCFAARKGYHEEGDEMVCNNCGQRFASIKINEVKGGCNPAPLTRTSTDDAVVIAVADIVKDNVSQTGQPLF